MAALTRRPVMRALVFQPPGGNEALSFTTNFPRPAANSLKSGEVQIRVAAAGLIPTELHWPIHQARDGSWPKRIVCPDYAGTVSAVADDVIEFRPGDEVMAVSYDTDDATDVRAYQGGASEYVNAPTTAVMSKPRNLSFQEAASVPVCAFTAWQAFHDQTRGQMRIGAEVLITGGGSATGLWAVQIAKLMGARVTVTASDASGIALLQQLGADEVVNYREERLEEKGRKFDVVLDIVGGDAYRQCTQVVKLKDDGGILISLVEYDAESKATQGVEGRFFIWALIKKQMHEIVALIEAGQLKATIDACFPLHQGVDAFAYAARGHCHGKVVLEI